MLKSSNWFEIALKTQQHNQIIELLQFNACYDKTTSDFYLENWQKAYFIYYYKKEKSQQEYQKKLWKLLLKDRLDNFGIESEEYLSGLFGASQFYQRIGDKEQYTKARKQVEQYWQDAYNTEKAKDSSLLLVDVSPHFPSCYNLKGSALEQKVCADQ